MTEAVMTSPGPERTRSRVLFEDAEVIASKVRAKPGEWFLVGGGEKSRRGVLSQTAYRIRHGFIAAFAAPEGGSWDVRVSTDRNVDRKYPVEVYLRFLLD